MEHERHLTAHNSSSFRHIIEILYLCILHFQKAHEDHTRKRLIATSGGTPSEVASLAGYDHLKLPVVALLAPLQFRMIIPQVQIPPLDVPVVGAPRSTKSANEGSSTTPSTHAFYPTQLVKMEDIDRWKANTEVVIEYTTNNLESIQNTLGLILVRLTNPNP